MLRYWSASQWLNVAGLKALVQPLGARLAMKVQPATSAPNGGPSRASAFVAPSLTASCAVVGASGGLRWVAVILVGLPANSPSFVQMFRLRNESVLVATPHICSFWRSSGSGPSHIHLRAGENYFKGVGAQSSSFRHVVSGLSQ